MLSKRKKTRISQVTEFTDSTADDLRAKTMKANDFIFEVIDGTICRSAFYFLPMDEQAKVTAFITALHELTGD